MTAGEFREVDLDLLADYLGGALDGTPDESVVARLVAEDPAWGATYQRLSAALPAVQADLVDWSASTPALPAAVADRITAALAAQPPLSAEPRPTVQEPLTAGEPLTVEEPVAAQPPLGAAAAAGPLAGVGERRRQPPAPRSADGSGGSGGLSGPGGPGSSGGSTGPGRRRRRWARIAGPVAVAAASLAVVGLGVDRWVTGGDDRAADTALSETAPEAAGPMAAMPFTLTAVPGLSSGVDHTAETLAAGGLAPAVPRQFGTHADGPARGTDGPDRATEEQRRQVPAALARLTDRPALDACLAGIAGAHGSSPIVVQVLDYATFERQPALVVEFVDARGARWAWASGPRCGLDGSGADTRYQARVG
ncbi:hypothetical protein [Micromonospora yangpuensis]|uniref:Uncharacterized protein n=1 Tax=Micromonospora yangpuensis TaxID=683228 RepID=A0A1C6TW20_9ACTN|nr:hypothetical protein [Micromonospora yangpuensis]GGM00910.1 hypothetical protein GCM10012279_18180 [Micromonospora yangpuensis]SCL46022.1 hypothetical protein GA0070617_0119 [Micromonospora yangpuensis]